MSMTQFYVAAATGNTTIRGDGTIVAAWATLNAGTGVKASLSTANVDETTSYSPKNELVRMVSAGGTADCFGKVENLSVPVKAGQVIYNFGDVVCYFLVKTA